MHENGRGGGHSPPRKTRSVRRQSASSSHPRRASERKTLWRGQSYLKGFRFKPEGLLRRNSGSCPLISGRGANVAKLFSASLQLHERRHDIAIHERLLTAPQRFPVYSDGQAKSRLVGFKRIMLTRLQPHVAARSYSVLI